MLQETEFSNNENPLMRRDETFESLIKTMEESPDAFSEKNRKEMKRLDICIKYIEVGEKRTMKVLYDAYDGIELRDPEDVEGNMEDILWDTLIEMGQEEYVLNNIKMLPLAGEIAKNMTGNEIKVFLEKYNEKAASIDLGQAKDGFKNKVTDRINN